MKTKHTLILMFQENQTTSSINNLISRLSSVQHDLDNLTQVTNDLKDEQEQRQMIIDVSSTLSLRYMRKVLQCYLVIFVVSRMNFFEVR